MTSYRKYTVHLQNRPAIGRTFYDGTATVRAEDDRQAEEIAINKVAAIHGHRDWIVTKVERLG